MLFCLNLSSTTAQSIGSSIEEVAQNKILLDSIVQSSGNIRSIRNPEFFKDPITQKQFLIKPTNPSLIFQHTNFHPYNWNDGALLPTSGNQQIFTAGASGKFKKFEFYISPEFVFAQNDPYEGFPTDHDQTTWRDYYRYYNYIETPKGFGLFPVRKLYGGQSFLRFTHKKISVEASTANQWWGPGQRNALLLSNNAPGMPHLSLKSYEPISTPLGSVEFEMLYGINFNASYPPADTNKVYRYYKLYSPKEDIQRFTKGFILSWQPKWINGLSLGIEQMDMRYLYETKRFSQWLPFQKPFREINNISQNRSLLLSALFFKYRIPNYAMEIYGEFGWNNYNRNFRDFIINPDRGLGTIVGFKKLFLKQNQSYWELKAELTNLQMQSVEDVFINTEPKSWYLHPHVRQGYTHAGQILGAGTGPGGSSQFLELNWRKKLNLIGLSLERKANNNDFYVYTFTNSFDFRRYWIDFSSTLRADWQFKQVLVGARFSSIWSNNYQWWLYTPGSFYFVRGRDLIRWAGHIQVTYLFNNS